MLRRISISARLPTRMGIPHFRLEILQGNVKCEIKANFGMGLSFWRNKSLHKLCLSIWMLHSTGKLNHVVIVLVPSSAPILMSSAGDTCQVLAVTQYTARELRIPTHFLLTTGISQRTKGKSI